MRTFFNTVAIAAALVAGIVSAFQNVPFLMFAKRVGLTLGLFYLIGLALNVLWGAASSYIGMVDRGERQTGGEGGEG